MIVKIIILDGKTLKNNFTIPTIIEGKGDYGFELAITKAIEIYYGVKTKMYLEDLLKIKLSEEEINKNFSVYMESKK